MWSETFIAALHRELCTYSTLHTATLTQSANRKRTTSAASGQEVASLWNSYAVLGRNLDRTRMQPAMDRNLQFKRGTSEFSPDRYLPSESPGEILVSPDVSNGLEYVHSRL